MQKWEDKLTLSWRRPISYRNQSTFLRSKSMNWFLYDIGLRHERVNIKKLFVWTEIFFLTFNMKIYHLFFVVANLFLSEINQINIYVTKCRMLQRNVKRVLITQILWELNIQQKPKKNYKYKLDLTFSVIQWLWS